MLHPFVIFRGRAYLDLAEYGVRTAHVCGGGGGGGGGWSWNITSSRMHPAPVSGIAAFPTSAIFLGGNLEAGAAIVCSGDYYERWMDAWMHGRMDGRMVGGGVSIMNTYTLSVVGGREWVVSVGGGQCW